MEKKVKKVIIEKPSKKTKKEKIDFKKIARNIGISVLFCIWACAAFYVINLIFSYAMLWILGKATVTQPLWTTIHSALVYSVSAITIILVPVKINKNWGINREKLGLTGLPTFTDIGLSIIGFVATILISGIFMQIAAKLNLFNTVQTQDVGYSNLSIGLERVIAFVALAFVAPIAEEIIYRGWLYDKIKDRVKVPVAIALVSIAFGAMHGQWNAGITVGVMSIVMCIQRELTGTIYAGILTHMLKNGIAFAFLIMQGVL